MVNLRVLWMIIMIMNEWTDGWSSEPCMSPHTEPGAEQGLITWEFLVSLVKK